MGKIINVQISGIQCDTKGCGYHDDYIHFNDYKSWLNKPCPKCGANLLTKEAHESAKNLIRFAKVVNFLFGWMVPKGQKYNSIITQQYDNHGMPAGIKIDKIDNT